MGYYFYPRSPCGERLQKNNETTKKHYEFLSTLSLRRATVSLAGLIGVNANFYPRSPCGERPQKDTKIMGCSYFYPRSPCGERLISTALLIPLTIFLSTLSLRRATWPGRLARPFFIISIHALLAESDIRKRQIIPIIQISIHALLAESDPLR